MIELGISAINARAHARQLRWLLKRCHEANGAASEQAVDEIRDMLNQADHFAGLQDSHVKDDRCLSCEDGDGGASGLPWHRRYVGNWLRLENAWQLLHVADESLVAIATDSMVLARAPQIAVHAKRWLGPEDSRLMQIAPLLANRASPLHHPVTQEDRYALAGILHAIHLSWDRSYARARSFRQLLIITAFLLSAAMTTLVVVGIRWPESLPMCTKGVDAVCASGFRGPTHGDVALVALIGAIAAGFSAVANVSNLRPLVDPYRTPLFQGLLKVPTGAFTAVLGVLAVEQGLQASAGLPSSQGGMLFLAFVFGYSQQLVTRFVDSYGAEIRSRLAGQRTRGGASPDERVESRP